MVSSTPLTGQERNGGQGCPTSATGFLRISRLVQVHRNGTHLHGLVLEARHRSAGLTAMLEVEQIQDFDELDLAARARARRGIDGEIDQLFAVAGPERQESFWIGMRTACARRPWNGNRASWIPGKQARSETPFPACTGYCSR